MTTVGLEFFVFKGQRLAFLASPDKKKFALKRQSMKKALLLLCLFAAAKFCDAQRIDSLYFHLYTDSLKKGFYNYINVDGKTADGRWMPLLAKDVFFVLKDSSSLRFQDNDLFIDSTYNAETVSIKAVLKSNPSVWKEVVIYIRKRGFNEPLPTNDEILHPNRNRRNNWRYSLLY